MRGKVPLEVIPGYTQDPDDPFQYIMNYCSCQHRELGQVYFCQLSGRNRKRDWCQLKGVKTNPALCNQSCNEKCKGPWP